MNTKKMNKGNPAPSSEMMDLNGNAVRLSNFAGERVYIRYWAFWCPIRLGEPEDISTPSIEDNGFKVPTIVAPGSKEEGSNEDFETWFIGVEHTKNIMVLPDIDGIYINRADVRGFLTSKYIDSDSALISLAPGHADNKTTRNAFEATD